MFTLVSIFEIIQYLNGTMETYAIGPDGGYAYKSIETYLAVTILWSFLLGIALYNIVNWTVTKKYNHAYINIALSYSLILFFLYGFRSLF